MNANGMMINIFAALCALFVNHCPGLYAIDIEKVELQSNLQASAKRIRELEDRLTNVARQQEVAALALANANALANEAVGRYESIREVVSSLGGEQLLGFNKDKAQQDLVSALSEIKSLRDSFAQFKLALNNTKSLLAEPTCDINLVRSILNSVESNDANSITQPVVVACKEDIGLVLAEIPSNPNAKIGAKVTIGDSKSISTPGVIVEVRDGTACILLQPSLEIASQVKVGSLVNLSSSNKF
jgi:hypothetical protein